MANARAPTNRDDAGRVLHLRPFAAATLATLCSVALWAEAPAPAQTEIARLRAALAARDAEIRALTERIERAERAVDEVRGAVALSDRGTIRVRTRLQAPSSNLPHDRALRAASAARLMIPGSSVMTVMPTGSMEPIFDERAILLLESAPFESLRPGDIVTYRHPEHDLPVVHRIVEKRGDRFWSKGDANARMDDVFVTRENYLQRVCGIIYGSASAPMVEPLSPAATASPP